MYQSTHREFTSNGRKANRRSGIRLVNLKPYGKNSEDKKRVHFLFLTPNPFICDDESFLSFSFLPVLSFCYYKSDLRGDRMFSIVNERFSSCSFVLSSRQSLSRLRRVAACIFQSAFIMIHKPLLYLLCCLNPWLGLVFVWEPWWKLFVRRMLHTHIHAGFME